MLVGKQPSQAQILIDTDDTGAFLEEQLRPSLFIDACQPAGQMLNNRMQPGYAHKNAVSAVLSRKLRISHAPEARFGKKFDGSSKSNVRANGLRPSKISGFDVD